MCTDNGHRGLDAPKVAASLLLILLPRVETEVAIRALAKLEFRSQDLVQFLTVQQVISIFFRSGLENTFPMQEIHFSRTRPSGATASDCWWGNCGRGDCCPTRQTVRELICIWSDTLIYNWYAVRSVYWSNSDQKPPYSPIKKKFQHIKPQLRSIFFDISQKNSKNFKVNLISVSPIKNRKSALFFKTFFKLFFEKKRLVRSPIQPSHSN
jgi:hypothetical protein